jgi:hypothetical protein
MSSIVENIAAANTAAKNQKKPSRGAITRLESNADLGMNSESIFNDEDIVDTLVNNEDFERVRRKS